MSPRAMIVDDHEAARIGLASVLETGKFGIAATACDGEQALSLLGQEQTDLVVLDVRMDSMDGISLLELIRQDHSELPIVMITAHDSPTYVARSFANGAHDFLLKADPVVTIQETLNHVCQLRQAVPGGRLDRVRKRLIEPIHKSDLPSEIPITPREAQVLRHIAFGLSNREIANSLAISVETVKEHVQNILRKMNASDRTDAAVRAVRLGLA